MPSSSAQSVLFFRVYREAALPLYAAMVEELCTSAHLPFQLATILEDIGQGFIRLADHVNAALEGRGLLGREVDPDLTVEAQIESLLARMLNGDQPATLDTIAQEYVGLNQAAFQDALRIALVMTHDLPLATTSRQE
jgi:hypothetical protein